MLIWLSDNRYIVDSPFLCDKHEIANGYICLIHKCIITIFTMDTR